MFLRNPLLYLLIILQYNICFAQIDISDKSLKPKLKAIPYDGSFMNFDSRLLISKEEMAGVKGEKVTLIEGFFDLKDINGQDVSYDLKDKINNKTFTVLEFIDDYQPSLKIINELGTFIFKPSYGDHYVFNRYLDYVKAQYLNKFFVPLYNKSTLTSIGGGKVNFSGTLEYLVNEVKFSKLQSGYGVVLRLNSKTDSFEFILAEQKGSSFASELDSGWIELKGIGILESGVILLEKDTFRKFVNSNKPFLSVIRNKEFKVGMSEKQCRYSWGMPYRSYYSFGYKVLEWGSGINSIDLYFKNDRLKFIR